MWNKEHGILGYHVYADGKPRVTNTEWDTKLKRTVLRVEIPHKEGGLLGSVAIARHPKSPDENWFVRASAFVHDRDDRSKATKKRGRQIATHRVLAAMECLINSDSPYSIPARAQVVHISDLTDRERALFEKPEKTEK